MYFKTIFLILILLAFCLPAISTDTQNVIPASEAEGVSLDGGHQLYIPPMTDDFMPGDFALTDAVTDAVYKMSPNGQVEVIVIGAPFDGTTGVAVDNAGNIIVGCETSLGIFRIDPTGGYTQLGSMSGFMSLLGDIDIDINGDYIIAGTSTLVRMTPTGQTSTVYSGTPLTGLQALCIDPVSGDMFIGNTSGTLWRLTPAGQITTILTSFGMIEGLEIDANGNIIVADETADALFLVDQAGNVSTITSGAPIDAPEDVCIDNAGNYFTTCDPASNEQVFKVTTGGIVTQVSNYPDFSALDGIAFYASTQVYDVSISLTPVGTPIQIPANGGNFEFNIMATNNELAAVNVSVWTTATLPGGNVFGPIIGPVTVIISPGMSIDRDRVQMVPEGAPTGMYTYDAYIGYYPNTVMEEDHFDFEKLAVDNGGVIVNGWNSWEITGNETSKTAANPQSIELFTAYPNPFNPETTIAFNLAEAGEASLRIYDVQGREIITLTEGWMPAGYRELTFNAADLPSGVYFAGFHIDGVYTVQKLLLIR